MQVSFDGPKHKYFCFVWGPILRLAWTSKMHCCKIPWLWPATVCSIFTIIDANYTHLDTSIPVLQQLQLWIDISVWLILTVIHLIWSESSLYALWIAIRTQTSFMRTKARQNVRPAKTQVSFGIRPVWSESLLCAQWVAIRTQAFSMLTAKTLIRLGGCPGWSESSVGAQAILLVLLCCGSYVKWTVSSNSTGS